MFLKKLPVTALLLLASVARANDIAFIDVTVIDPASGAMQQGHNVIVADGRIKEIGPAGSVPAGDAARIIAGKGKFLVPGLADMHVHLEHFEDPAVLRSFLRHGITFVRNMDGNARILEWRDRIARGELQGPEIFTAGPIIDGARPADPAYVSVKTPAEGRRAVSVQADAGYDFIKTYHGLDVKTFQAVQRAAAAHGMNTAGHVPFRTGILEASADGLGSIEHLDGYDELVEAEDSPYRHRWHWRKLVFAFPVDQGAVKKAAAASAEQNVWNVPTLMVKDWRWLDPAVRKEREQLAMNHEVPVRIRATWNPENWQGERASLYRNLDQQDLAAVETGFRNALSVVRELHDAGAPLLAGTDTPNPYVIPGLSLHEELQHFVAAGLSPLEALRTATVNPARWLQREATHACLRPGCKADLVLLNADPLQDIAALQSIEGVMANGEWMQID